MKTLVISAALALTAVVASQPANAAILFDVYGEAQYWQTDVSGGYAFRENFDEFELEDESQTRLSLAFQHPVPLLPNIRIETQDLKSMEASEGIELQPAELDLSHDTLTLYYAFLDNTLVRLHAGVAAKRFDGFVRDRDGRDVSLSETIPTAYAMVGAGLPFSGLSVYARGHLLAIDDSSLRDIEAGLQYRLFRAGGVLDGNIQVGYRSFSVEFDDVAGLYSDVEFKGPFVGFQLHF